MMTIFERVSFRTKIYGLVLVLLTVTAIVGGVSYRTSKGLVESYSKIGDFSLPNTRNLLFALSNIRRARIYLLAMAVPGTSLDENKKNAENSEKSMNDFDQSIKNYLAVDFGPGEEDLYNKGVKSQIEANRAAMKKAMELWLKNPDDTSAEVKEMRTVLVNDLPKIASQLTSGIDALVAYHDNTASEFMAEATAKRKAGEVIMLGVTISSIIFGSILAFLLVRTLSKTLMEVNELLDTTSDQIVSASGQVAAASQGLSQASTEQAASLQQTSSAVEQLSAMVDRNTSSAQSTAAIAADSQDKANVGKSNVDRMAQSMEEIDSSNDAIMSQIIDSSNQMAGIVSLIQEIGSKTKVINDIVFQTKLLSFNASVEAARAGEHGKGFAVVAEEVGNLAQMSGGAAKEISTILDSSIEKVEGIVRDIQKNVTELTAASKQKVQGGIQVSQQCSNILNEIVGSTMKSATIATEIATAGKEQSHGIQEINKAMIQLNLVTQQNSSSSEQTATAAEQLSSQALSLKQAVSKLTETLEGKKAA